MWEPNQIIDPNSPTLALHPVLRAWPLSWRLSAVPLAIGTNAIIKLCPRMTNCWIALSHSWLQLLNIRPINGSGELRRCNNDDSF